MRAGLAPRTGVLDHRAPAGEVGREAEVVDPTYRALEDGPHPPQKESVGAAGRVHEEAPIGLQQAAQAE